MSSFRPFFHKLRKKRIIEILAAFVGGGWLILEFVHWILIDHYHFPEKTLDVTFDLLLSNQKIRPSCHAKRLEDWGEWMPEELIRQRNRWLRIIIFPDEMKGK